MEDLTVQVIAEIKARNEVIGLRLEYMIQLQTDRSSDREYNLLKLLGLINNAERKLESILQTTSTHLQPSEEPLVEVHEVIETTKMMDEIGSEELVVDSINSEMVTDCSQISQDFSIPSETEQDESLDYKFIPPFFFEEKEDSIIIDPLTEKPISNLGDSSDIRGSQMETATGKMVEYCEHLREISNNPTKLIRKGCLSLLSYYSRTLFDRGKDYDLLKGFSGFAGDYALCPKITCLCSSLLLECSILMDNYNEEFVQELILIHGYQSSWLFSESIVGMLAKGGVASTAGMLFDKMPDSEFWNLGGVGDDFLLQLQLGKHDFYECLRWWDNQVLVQQKTLIYGYQSKLLLMNSYVLLFVKTGDCGDIGYMSVKKAQRNNVYKSTLTSMLGIYKKNIVYELVSEHGDQLDWWFTDSIVAVLVKICDSDACKLWYKWLQQGNVLGNVFLFQLTEGDDFFLKFKKGVRTWYFYHSRIVPLLQSLSLIPGIQGILTTRVGVVQIFTMMRRQVYFLCWGFISSAQEISATIPVGQLSNKVTLYFLDGCCRLLVKVVEMAVILKLLERITLIQIKGEIILVVTGKWEFSLFTTGSRTVDSVNWIYKGSISFISYSWTRILAGLVGTQFLLLVIQILNVLMLVYLWGWKFKLLSTSLRSMRNCSGSSGLTWVFIVLLVLPRSTEQPRSFLHYVMLFSASCVPSSKLFSHKFLDMLKDDWIRIHAFYPVLILTISRSCLWFSRPGFFVYSRMPLSRVYDSLRVRDAVMKLKFYERIMRVQIILSMIHIPVVLILVVRSLWKFELLPWGLWGARNVSWISLTSRTIHFFVGQVDCKVTLAKEGKEIVMQGRRGQAETAGLCQAVRLLIRYAHYTNINISFVTSLYTSQSASGCNYKEEEKYISRDLQLWKGRYIEESLSSVYMLATIRDEIVSLTQKPATQLDGILVLIHGTQLKDTYSSFRDKGGPTCDNHQSSMLERKPNRLVAVTTIRDVHCSGREMMSMLHPKWKGLPDCALYLLYSCNQPIAIIMRKQGWNLCTATRVLEMDEVYSGKYSILWHLYNLDCKDFPTPVELISTLASNSILTGIFVSEAATEVCLVAPAPAKIQDDLQLSSSSLRTRMFNRGRYCHVPVGGYHRVRGCP